MAKDKTEDLQAQHQAEGMEIEYKGEKISADILMSQFWSTLQLFADGEDAAQTAVKEAPEPVSMEDAAQLTAAANRKDLNLEPDLQLFGTQAVKKRKPRKKKPAQPGSPVRYRQLPSSPIVNGIKEITESGKDIKSLTARNVSHSSNYSVEAKEQDLMEVTRTNAHDKSSVVIQLHTDLMTDSNKAFRKIFVFILTKIKENATTKGKVTTVHPFECPAQELVDIGAYAGYTSAKKGLLQAVKAISGLSVGEVTPGKKAGVYPLFKGIEVYPGNTNYVLTPNEMVNWNSFLRYCTFIPDWAFSLKNRAFQLMWNICALARQNTTRIEENGYFTISFRAIQTYLGIPGKSKNASRDIKDAIDDAIKEIEKCQKESSCGMDLSFEMVSDDSLQAKEWLDTGKLKVFVSGELGESFKFTARKTAKAIEKKAKRKQNNEDKAIQKALASHLEKQMETAGAAE